MKAGRVLTLAALAMFTVAVVPAMAQDMPLGDLARKNKKETSKSKKVITNEDIPESPSAGSASGAPASSGATGASAANSPAAPDGQPQAEGQAAPASGAQVNAAAAEEEDPVDAEIQQIQSELDALKHEAGVGVRSIQKLEEQLRDPNLSEARRRTYEDILASGTDKVGSLESQITQKEQALQQAQDKKKAKEAAARRPAAAPK